ncbi:MAG: hypothetical protein QM715_02660 [Nibricoccus sp.]
MPDVPDSPETAALPPQEALPEQVTSPGAEPSAAIRPLRSPVTAGQRWRNYQIGDQIDTEIGWLYHAVNVGMLEDVQIRIMPCGDDSAVRTQAWQELHSMSRAGVLRGIEAVEEDGFRFEITPPLPATTLHEWAACRKATIEDIEHIVRQVGDALIAMHDRGLVHLNLRPETIYLPAEGSVAQIIVGGLEFVTLYNQPGLIPMPVDPLYAPPEAAGLSKHSPGAGLRAWDWWSLGRILQEVTLGRHVLGLVMNRDISLESPEVRTRAEALLLERDPKAPRAGAVELMPPMSQRLTDLLRGLLTSSRDGRWGTDEIQRWLKQQPVKDRYQLARNEQLFGWKDRMFTVAEAAEFFTHDAEWADGVKNLFATDDATTLVYFVGDRPEYRQVRDKIEELHKFMQIPSWKDLPTDARESVIAAAAWLLLGGEDAKLTLFGQRVDAACVKGLFARGGVASGVAMVKALTAKPYIKLIEQADPDAARLLSTLGATVSGEAISVAISQGWLDLSNPADYARLLLLAMEGERKLFDVRKSLQERFACSREKHIQHLLTQPRLTNAELVLLASTAAQPERYGYITHENYRKERYEELRQRAEKLSQALFWLRLAQAMRCGYVLFGPWKYLLGGWLLLGLAAAALRQWAQLPLWLAGAVVVFVALRFTAGKWLTLLVRRHAPAAAPWRFNTPLLRGQNEAATLLAGAGKPVSQRDLINELSAIYHEAAGLALKPAPAPLPAAGLALPAWFCAVFVWLLVLLVPVGGRIQQAFTAKSEIAPVDPQTAVLRAIEKSLTPAAPGEERTLEDVFYDSPVSPRARWSVARPAAAPSVPLMDVKPATPDDVARALIDGQRLLLPYQQSTVDALIAVPVGGKDGSGIMLYDGRNRRVLERQVLLPRERPAEKSWFEIEKLKVFYAGPPPPVPPPPPKPVVDPQKPRDTSDLPEREVRRGAYQETPMPADQKATNAQPLSEALDTMAP